MYNDDAKLTCAEFDGVALLLSSVVVFYDQLKHLPLTVVQWTTTTAFCRGTLAFRLHSESIVYAPTSRQSDPGKRFNSDRSVQSPAVNY